MRNFIKITDNISYIQKNHEPLSAEVVLIKGHNFTWLFDTGNGEKISNCINAVSAHKKTILSHFHPDHMANVYKVHPDTIYVSANTSGYLHLYATEYVQDSLTLFRSNSCSVSADICTASGITQNTDTATPCNNSCTAAPAITIINKEITITDGITLKILPIPSSHAKGSLGMLVDNEYLFLGDAAYSGTRHGRHIYNVQLLKELIQLLHTLSVKYICLSHNEPFVKSSEEIIAWLEEIYTKREKNNPYIEIVFN